MPGIFTCFGGNVPRHPLDLHDHHAALAARGLCHRQHFAEHGLVFHRHVAVFVGGGAAQKGHVDRKRLEAQPLFAVELHHFNQFFAGARTLFRALLTRVDKRAEPCLGDQAGAARGHVAHQLRQHALRQRIGLDLVLRGERDEPRRIHQRTGDGALEQAFARQMRGAQRRAVADADHADRRDAGRLLFPFEAAADRRQQIFRYRMPAARAADQYRVSGFEQLRCFIACNPFHRPFSCHRGP
jgi:hypothetical protein